MNASGSGGKTHLHGISKRGDTYLRTLLIHGARSVVTRAKAPGLWVERNAPTLRCSKHLYVIPAQAGIQCVNLQPEGLQTKECGALAPNLTLP
jgi:hypothetical protein